MQHLLLRFGVVAALCDRSVRYGEARRRGLPVEHHRAGSIRAFVDGIGIFGKDAAIGRVARALEGRRRHANRDLIPREAWKLIDMARGGESWASLSRRMGFGQGHNLHVGTRALSRHRMSRFAEAGGSETEAPRRKRRVLGRDREYRAARDGAIYDLTIPGTHNFVANDVCVHNTAMALNAIWHASGEKKMPVAIFSLEMSKSSSSSGSSRRPRVSPRRL